MTTLTDSCTVDLQFVMQDGIVSPKWIHSKCWFGRCSHHFEDRHPSRHFSMNGTLEPGSLKNPPSLKKLPRIGKYCQAAPRFNSILATCLRGSHWSPPIIPTGSIVSASTIVMGFYPVRSIACPRIERRRRQFKPALYPFWRWFDFGRHRATSIFASTSFESANCFDSHVVIAGNLATQSGVCDSLGLKHSLFSGGDAFRFP